VSFVGENHEEIGRHAKKECNGYSRFGQTAFDNHETRKSC
jgi:hypothetical protein